MTLKKTTFHILVSAALSIVACMVYNSIYSQAFYVDFSKVLNPIGIVLSCLIGCGLMGAGTFLVLKWKGKKWLGVLNILIATLSFVSIISVLGMVLPLDIESPEMFPGLAVPMHFFPALAFFSVASFFE
ncbi:MAG TPA: hypothetical protein VK766_01095 [Cytophagaceae bacterium]|jgi:hypothetical protein|nr:hypothetical protein [Cytophagaceae bacterium]